MCVVDLVASDTFSQLLPIGVASFEAAPSAALEILSSGERGLVEDASPRRRSHFSSGRWCAKRAAASIGVTLDELLPADDGSPGWPPGIVGSITHTAGLAASAVASAHSFRALGIDAEPASPLPEGVLDAVSSLTERQSLPQQRLMDTTLFCAKEAAYKALNSYFTAANRKEELGAITFTSLQVAIDQKGSLSFSGRDNLTRPAARIIPRVQGRWTVGRHVRVACWISL